MRTTTKAALGALLMSSTGAANAVVPLVDVDVTTGYWNADPSGTIQSGGDPIGVDNDLGYDSEGHNNFAIRFAHPVPVIPNLRLRYNDIEHDGTGNVSKKFEGNSYGTDVKSRTDLTHYDYTAFYTAPIPVVTLDLGLNVKHFDGEVTLKEQGGNTDTVEVDEFLPMGHVRADVDLPLTGLGAGAELNYISFDGDSATDVEGYISFNADPVYIQGGYRQFDVDVDASGDLNVDTELSGPFVRLGVGF
ncbi:TIGR04219 family outer membrane beta-barrel protein [Salicola sp. Rm-C-2C1-2]|uniref:TIGR04219 family outer membrane beta-barrel protein n=1 Tax=Salicola sp. Rm-C-2C1-2 TaxID=3141321 RepID=UPI0032E37E09